MRRRRHTTTLSLDASWLGAPENPTPALTLRVNHGQLLVVDGLRGGQLRLVPGEQLVIRPHGTDTGDPGFGFAVDFYAAEHRRK